MSAKRDHHYLLVVSVLDGRKFPHRPSESVRIDVKFDGQVLSSLPVPLVEEPVFDTDMAFRLTGKQLKDHKVQRTPIKIEVNRVNKRTQSVEKIGYQTLDLRSYAVEVGSPRITWFTLLGAQAMKAKPELHIGVSVDEDTELQNEELAQAEFTRSARNKNYWLRHQPVRIDNADGSSHYQIGPSKDSTHLFSMSIVLAFVSNVDQFFGSSNPFPGSPRLFFHYELLENHITTKPFDDLSSSDLVPERITFRLRSSFELLKEYFLNQKSVTIRLCQGDGIIIAVSELLLDEVFPISMDIASLPFLLEKEILLHPVPDNKFGIPEDLELPAGHAPAVGLACEVSVVQKLDSSGFSRTLTLEEAKPFVDEIHKLSQTLRPKSAKTASNSSRPAPRSKSTHGFSQLTEDEMQSFSSLSYPAAEMPEDGAVEKPRNVVREVHKRPEPEHEEHKERDTMERKKTHSSHTENSERISSKSASTQISPPVHKRTDEPIETHPVVKITGTQTTPFGEQNNYGDNSTSPATRRYVCTIFLYKIRVTSPSFRYSSPVYLRYQYPFFGSAIPIVTRPPVEIHPNQDAVLNNALTQFTFGCSEMELITAFRRAPVCIEVWKSGIGTLQDELIGQARLRLDLLYRAESTTLFENEKPYTRRSYETTLEVIDLQSDRYPKLADVTVCTTLDDYGDIQRQMVNVMPPPVERPLMYYDAYRPETSSRPPGFAPKPNVVDLEKQAAIELEIWKEREERKFKTQLKKREDDALRNLAEEWERKTQHQKTFVDDNLRKNKELEDELKKMIVDNRKKEEDLKGRERRVAEAEQFLMSEKARLTKDIDDVQRTVIQEYSKRLELEHSAQVLLKAEIRQLSSQLEDLNKRLLERDEQIFRLKTGEREKPLQNQEIQIEMNRLTLEKNDLERRVQSEMEAKTHYKQEWGKASKEIAKMRVRLESEHDRRLEEKEREFELLRTELARRSQNGTREKSAGFSQNAVQYSHEYDGSDTARRKDRLAIQFGGTESKSEDNHLDNLSDLENEENIHLDINHLGLTDSESESDEESTTNPEKRLLEAMNQRNMLLNTGIYKLNDDVIVEIDRKVQRMKTLIRERKA